MKKYLVYKVNGGLNHMLIRINKVIELSKILNRFLIIDTESKIFKYNFNDFFHINNIEYSTDLSILDKFNIPYLYKSVNILNKDSSDKRKCLKSGSDVYIFKTTFEELQKDENTVLFVTEPKVECNKWSVKLNKNIFDKLKKMNCDNYIGVHYRNTDRKADTDAIIKNIYKYKHIKTLYLATDDYYAYNVFKNELKNDFNIIQYTKPFKLDNTTPNALHRLKTNKYDIIINALTDMYNLYKSTIFIQSIQLNGYGKSSFSKNVLAFRNNKYNNLFE